MDVSFLEPVFAAHGPFATVCADVRHTSGSAAAELELRVRAHRERLTGGKAHRTTSSRRSGRGSVAAVLRYTDASTPSA